MIFRRIIIILLATLLAIFVQGTLLKSVFPNIYVPNVLVGVLLFLSFYEANTFGVIMAFTTGVLLDLFSHQYLGPWAGAFVITFAIFVVISQRIFASSGLIIFIMGLLASAMIDLIYVFLILPYRSLGDSWYVTIIIEALLSAILAPLAFMLVKRFYPLPRANPGFLERPR